VSSRCDADIVLKLLYPTRVSRVGSTETSDEDVNADDEVKLSSPTLLDSRRMNGRLPPPMSIIAELTPNLVPPTSSLYGLLRMISTAWSLAPGDSGMCCSVANVVASLGVGRASRGGVWQSKRQVYLDPRAVAPHASRRTTQRPPSNNHT
jgi:hypothetical protein